MRRIRFTGGSRILTVIGLLIALGSVPASPASSQTGPDFGGYGANALGAGFTVFPSLPATLPYVDEPAEGTLAHGLAVLTTGGFGFGRASSVWPGTPIAGIRVLVETAGGPALPLPDYPLAVESTERDDPKRSTAPGVVMESDVDPDRSEVVSAMSGMAIPGFFSADSIQTTSRSLLGDGLLVAESVSRTDGFEAAGGVVTIDSVVSRSRTQSDSVAGACDGGLTVTGLSIGGQPATVDETGVHAAGEPVVPGTDANEQISQALAASGVTVKVLGDIEDCDGPAASRTTAGLLVSVPLPGIGAIPPGGSFNVILGRTTTEVAATPAISFDFDAPLPDLGEPPVLADVVPRVPGPSGAASDAPVELPPDPDVPTRDDPPLAPVGEVSGLSYTFGGVPASLVIGMLLLAVPGARRVGRYLERVMASVETGA